MGGSWFVKIGVDRALLNWSGLGACPDILGKMECVSKGVVQTGEVFSGQTD
jgi:hypothetical protein